MWGCLGDTIIYITKTLKKIKKNNYETKNWKIITQKS